MKNLIPNNDIEFVEMFQVEELEERLENKWEAEAGTSTNSGGTTVNTKVKWSQ